MDPWARELLDGLARERMGDAGGTAAITSANANHRNAIAFRYGFPGIPAFVNANPHRRSGIAGGFWLPMTEEAYARTLGAKQVGAYALRPDEVGFEIVDPEEVIQFIHDEGLLGNIPPADERWLARVFRAYNPRASLWNDTLDPNHGITATLNNIFTIDARPTIRDRILTSSHHAAGVVRAARDPNNVMEWIDVLRDPSPTIGTRQEVIDHIFDSRYTGAIGTREYDNAKLAFEDWLSELSDWNNVSYGVNTPVWWQRPGFDPATVTPDRPDNPPMNVNYPFDEMLGSWGDMKP